MSVLIEMSRESVEAGGRDRYSVSLPAWELLLDIGKAFGWQPMGVSYARKLSGKEPETVALHDCRPGNHRDQRKIGADDAIAWATALNNALQSPHLTSMLDGRTPSVVLQGDTTAEQMRSVNAPFDVTMKEFIQYAYGGAFSFACAV